MKEKVEQLVVDFKKTKEQFVNEFKENFKVFTKEIFDKYRSLESFGWNQYTPYFNDGETCTFSANIDYIYINGENEDERNDLNETKIIQWGSWDRNSQSYVGRLEEPNSEYNKELSDAYNEVKSILNLIPDELFLEMFGDHCSVTVTPTGVEVDGYDHD